MTSTNRGLNRLLLAITGLLLLAAGAAAIALAAVPGAAAAWRSTAKDLPASAPQWVAAPAVGTASVLTVVVGAVALVLAVLLVVFVVRHGGGRTAEVVDRVSGPAGATRIEIGVPRALLEQELADRPEFVAASVSAYRVRRTPALKVSVRCRRGVAPSDATAIVVDALKGLDEILGTSVPAFVQVGGGFRSRHSDRARFA